MQEIQRIEKIFRMLSSTHDGEIVNAVNAIRKLLLAQDKTFNDLANFLFHDSETSTHGAFTDDLYEKMRRDYTSHPFSRSYGGGHYTAYNARRRTHNAEEWMEMCDYLIRMPTVMTTWESTFINDINDGLTNGRFHLSQKQQRWLNSIYQKYTGNNA